MSGQPTGTVTFLFTDIEGSTRRWDQDAEGMGSALAHHDAIVRSAVEHHQGFVFATGGDGFAVAFGVPDHAVDCAVAIQIALEARGLPPVRMGVHTGTALERDGDYFGPDVNRAARLMAVAHGGQVLVSGAAAQFADRCELRDLGEHRLRDLSRPERVFQACADGLNDNFPPLRSLDAFATNLPVELTTFVGRDDEVKRLVTLVGAHRLVTVTGVGGVGKTRLALQAAAELFDRFPDGVWLCELAAADDANALCEVVSESLGVKRLDSSGMDAICEYLRSRNALIVVDNCEHLLDDVANAVEAILHRAPGVHILATSREGLAVAGEQIEPLRSLQVPPPNGGVADIAASPAARLFQDRALAAAPGFAIDQASANAVAEICRRLDGIPLAIELAAARVASMRVGEIAALLDERFRLLTGRRGRGVERHQTLRAAVDWSYSLLSGREQQLFDRLGVFAGSFDAEAARAVAGADLDRFDALEILGELVAKSMVTVDDSDLATSRYRLLETLRQYALERLDSREETDELRRRHVLHYAAFAREAGPGLTSSAELVWRPRVRAEIDNLRAAVGWSLDSDDRTDIDPALEIIAALAFEAVGFRASGIGQWAERAMSNKAAVGSAAEARVAVVAGYGAFHRLDFSMARQYAELAIARAADSGTHALADALMGNLAALIGDTAEAARLDVEALARLDASGTVGWERFTLVPAALFAMISGDAEQGNRIADTMLAHGRALGWPTGLAIALYAKGFTNQERAPDVALQACNESIELTEHGASDVVYGHCHIVCGAVHRNAGDVASAATEFADAITYSLDIGDLIEVGSAMSFIVPMIVRAGEPDAGVTLGAGMLDGPFAMLNFNAAAPTLQAEFEAALETARRQLGEARYEQARNRGAAMTMDELIAVALHTLRALA